MGWPKPALVGRWSKPQAGGIPVEMREGAIPLSYAQERMWFLDQLGLVGSAYNMPRIVSLTGSLNVRALVESFREVIRRHESLRTRFAVHDGVPYQLIDSIGGFELNQVDLTLITDIDELSRQLEDYSRREQLHRFELSKGPLLRAVLVRINPNRHILLLTLHHIIADGWSIEILRRELGVLYDAYSQLEESPLPEPALQYADYSIWQRKWLRGEVLENQLSYWKKQLHGAAPQLDLPTDFRRPTVRSFEGAEHRFKLSPDLSRDLEKLARRVGATLFVTLLTAYQVLLWRWSGQRDIVVGVPAAGRGRPEIEGTIGFFVNTLALRTEIREEESFSQLLTRVMSDVALEAFEHQDLPFELLVKELRPNRDLTRQPIFQVMLVFENYPIGQLEQQGTMWAWTRPERSVAHFDLTLYLVKRADGIACAFEYSTDLFERRTIERMADNLQVLLAGIVSDEKHSINRLPVISEAEKRQLLDWNATKRPYPVAEMAHEAFEYQVSSTPHAQAVVCGEACLSYTQLNRRANQLARYLRASHVHPDQPVALCLDRSIEMLVAILGTIKAGGACLPLDPNYPAERLEYMVRDAAPAVLITERHLESALPKSTIPVVLLEQIAEELADLSEENLSAKSLGITSQNSLYVLYTSGSTGRPKGTAMTHLAMVNLIEWHKSLFPDTAGQRVLQFAALSFDVAFQEVLSTLSLGATLVLIDDRTRRDAELLLQFIKECSIQRLFVPPLMLQSLSEVAERTAEFPTNLRDVVTAGEQLRISPEIALLFQRIVGCRLHNHYGPTETHVVTTATLGEDPSQWPTLPPIGKPTANTQIHILDPYQQQVPIGVTGDIYIGGAALARGYRGWPTLTAERFVASFIDGGAGDRLYKTGDLGRWRSDGMVEYFGRNDDQVKIRGYRIELAEIERELAKHDGVKEAAALVREDSPGKRYLVAYITRHTALRPSISELQAFLKGKLPEYMVPGAFVWLESLPVTPSGKLDRRSLPLPDSDAYLNREFMAPQGQIENAIAKIWDELLPARRIGRGDNFFELGGHSLLAVTAVSKMNHQLQAALRVTDIYQHPTIQELSLRVRIGRQEEVALDLTRESSLGDEIQALRGACNGVPKAVLLTGGTGFVGRFLLAELLQDSNLIVYCLVRASSARAAEFRLRTVLQTWDLWRDEFSDRVVAIAGDLRFKRLGLSETDYQMIIKEVDSIYHCATSMNHLETYSMAKLANVESVRELLKMGTTHKPKVLNYVSTLGIFRSAKGIHRRVVDENTDIQKEVHSTSGGYIASKWVAEAILMRACERGIPCNIYRVGLVWADAKLGRYDELQRVYRIVKSSLLSGYGIRDYRLPADPIPVDYVARAITLLSRMHTDGNRVFHICSPSERTYGIFERLNDIAGTSLDLVSYYDWICEIKNLHQRGVLMPVVPLVEFAFSMDSDSFAEHHREHAAAAVLVNSSRTLRELHAHGIRPPPLSDDLLKICVDSMFLRDAGLREVVMRAGRRLATTVEQNVVG